MPRPTGLHRSVPAAPRGCDRGGAFKRVARTALWSSSHSGNGRENGDASEVTPRRYICAVSRTKLSRNGARGAVTVDRPHPYQNGCDLSTGTNPGDLFAPFGSLQKGLAAGAAKSPQIKRYGTNPAGGASSSPTARLGGQILLLQATRQGCRALQGCIVRCPPHHGDATGEARLSG